MINHLCPLEVRKEPLELEKPKFIYRVASLRQTLALFSILTAKTEDHVLLDLDMFCIL